MQTNQPPAPFSSREMCDLSCRTNASNATDRTRIPAKPTSDSTREARLSQYWNKDASELIRRIKSDDPAEVMPPPDSKLSLTDREIVTLDKWISTGAEYEKHWSFQDIGRPIVPSVSVEIPGWSQQISGAPAMNEIDHFVAETLKQRHLLPQPQASRERLIRRLYFDLTGLPPTIEQIDSFLNDDTAVAYETVVDRLLASDAFGERMASDWLDVARYSDTYGYQVDRDRYVWPWRDWIIRAFNSNLPFDEFITWQLAGDLLPNPTDDQLLATTFNRLHPQKVEGGSVPEEFRVEYVADRTHTFGTAFLGLTLECCRCHDHKYDPISQREYYQLFAFFNNVDEAGLYSFFTNSVPTPAKLMATEEQKAQIDAAHKAVVAAESKLERVKSLQLSAFGDWLRKEASAPESLPGQLEHHTFDDGNGANETIAGKFGKAARLTGDDSIGLKVGDFRRSQPFTISLWLNTPDAKDRAVIFHRSRAWTDAGSRGYQLLMEDGKLSFSLIHFWPGNAIRIRTTEPVETDTWLQCTVSYDGSSRAAGLGLYINGQPASCEVVRDNLYKNITGGGGNNISIGARFRDRGFTDGLVDELRVFERELTGVEVDANFAAASFSDRIACARQQGSLDEHDSLYEYFLAAHSRPYKNALRDLQATRQSHNALIDGIHEIMIMRELGVRRQTYVLNRGAYDAPTDAVDPGTPAALPPFPMDAPRNRLGLARWLTSNENPLLARVSVNRFWKICFGDELVRTPEDFGSQGSQPTNPALLDWLASDFMANDWNVKRLLKQMVMSSTYRQRSTPSNAVELEELVRIDPQNQWYARAPRYRLPAEMIRDNALFTSTLLANKIGGPSVKPYEVSVSFKPLAHDKGEGLYRRSLYTFWKRTAPAPVMMALDASKRDVCSVKRERTASPLQALVLLNDPQFVEASRVLAGRLLADRPDVDDVPSLIRIAFRRLTSRRPTEKETEVLLSLYDEQLSYFRATTSNTSQFLATGHQSINPDLDQDRLAALAVVVNTIMNLDECVTKR